MPHSHHSHSGRFCAHASPDTSPESMLARAHEMGFDTYHLTEHVPRLLVSHLYPEEVEAGLNTKTLRQRFEAYLVEARRCQAKWSEEYGMNVLVGAETEWMGGKKEKEEAQWWPFLRDVLGEEEPENETTSKVGTGVAAKKSKVDFVVGSLHHVHDVPIDFDKTTFDRALGRYLTSEAKEGQNEATLGAEALSDQQRRRKAHLGLVIDYLEAQYRMLLTVRPEVIGHFDLFRLFDADFSLAEELIIEGVDQEYQEAIRMARKLIKRNVSFAASYGALFEINASSVRKGWKSPYPGEEVLDIILKAEGRVCLSDDAHAHQQVGLNYHVARDYLIRKGVKSVWVLERDTEEIHVNHDGSSAEKDEEEARQAREQSGVPGLGAPTRFKRGARAKSVPDWDKKASFWSKYPPSSIHE